MRDPVALLEQMLAIPSPSGAEGELALFLEKTMNDLGFTARRDEVGNVIGDIGSGAGPTVLFLSHLDTVDQPLPVRRTESRLYGRGAVDAQGPLAAMISAAAALPSFPGTLRVVGAVEEERLSKGAHHLIETMPAPDAVVIGEPGGRCGVVLGYKGKIDVSYVVRRAPTHSTNPLPKASEVAVGFWGDLLGALGPSLDHGSFGLPAATLRGISGSAVEAWVDVDCRIPVGFDVAEFASRLHARANGGVVSVVRDIPAVRRGRADPVARCLSGAIRRLGETPRPMLKTGTSDMNTVSLLWGDVPMAAYGPGDSSLDHGEEEYIEIGEYLMGVDVLMGAAEELAGAL